MKTWILSSDSQIPSTKRLLKALKKSKIETEVLNPLELHIEFGQLGPNLFHLGHKLKLPDLILPRLGWNSLSYGLRLTRYFEAIGLPVLNCAESLEKASDKLLSLQVLHQAKIPVPQTRFSHSLLPTDLHLFAKKEAHVFKTMHGSQGFGVTWQKTRRQSQAQIDAYRTAQVPVLVQELIEESFGQDIRAFVIDGEIVASMKRRGPKGDLRSNLHQNGKSQKVKLTQEENQFCLQTCQALGLYYAGVDFLRTKKGPVFLEANPFPGFEGISETSQLDIAELFVDSILR